jgi:hypothetical protein
MSLATILEGRERAAAPVSLLPPVENPGRQKIEDALDVIAAEIARLRLLQKADDRRRRARAEVAEITARSLAKVEERARDRDRMISVDKKWFWDVAQALLERLHGAQRVQLEKDLNAIVDREQRLNGG